MHPPFLHTTRYTIFGDLLRKIAKNFGEKLTENLNRNPGFSILATAT
jgi:hypothetical protein